MNNLLTLVLVLLGGWSFASAQSLAERAERLHRDAFVMDAHVHFINRQLYLGGDFGQRPNIASRAGIGVDLPRVREGGLDAVFFNLYREPDYSRQHFEVKQTLRLLDVAIEQIHKNQDKVEVALNADDIERINRAGKLAAVLDLEGGYDMDGDLGVLRSLYRLGLRSVQFADNNENNAFADSSCCTPKWNGINDRGRTILHEMNRLGMLVNLAHASDATWLQIVESSQDPVIATHQGVRAFNNLPTNASDEMLKKLAAKGGVIGVHFSPNSFSPRFTEWARSRSAAHGPTIGAAAGFEEIYNHYRLSYMLEPTPPPDEVLQGSLPRLVEVIDYCVRLMGEDHVGLGSDFGGGPDPRAGLKDISQYGMITRALLEKGYPEERIRKIVGGNLLRLFRQVTTKSTR